MISLRGVSLVYPNGVRALDNVNLEIAKGDFVFLVGHSGTGKSSLLRLLYREAKSDGRRDHRRRHPRRPLAAQPHPGVAPPSRRRLPRLQAARRQDGLGERRLRDASHRRAHARRHAPGAARARSRRALAQEPHVPKRALRRRAAAHRDRPRARQQSEDPALRRADRESRPGQHHAKSRRCCCASISRERPSSSRLTTKPSSTACAAASSGWKTAASPPTRSEGTTILDSGKVKFFLGEVLRNFYAQRRDASDGDRDGRDHDRPARPLSLRARGARRARRQAARSDRGLRLSAPAT